MINEDLKTLTKLHTFNQLISKAAIALEDIDNFDLVSENPISEGTFLELQELHALRCITLIQYVLYNAETLIEEFVSDIIETP